MTELDLQDLGVRWLPLSPWGAGDRAGSNAWALENPDLSLTLFDCGDGSPASLAALSNGLADHGATIREVRRVIVSHADPAHVGGLRWVLRNAAGSVEVFVSGPERGQLQLPAELTTEVRSGQELEFRRFAATVVLCAGHSRGLLALHAKRERLLFSSDQLVADAALADELERERSPAELSAYRSSLERLGWLDVSVVLPGRGPPFAGHRRVVREVLADLDRRRPRLSRERLRGGAARRADAGPQDLAPFPLASSAS